MSPPPLWPLLSGGLAALVRIGHGLPFPAPHNLGPQCQTGNVALYVWAVASGGIKATADLAYASWFALLGGVVTLVRATGRGRRRSEAVAVLLVALTPVAWMPLLEYFHPQDLLALGLVLGGTACALRRQWVWAGILLGLAVTAQQFALLGLIPVVVVAPADVRMRLGSAAAVAWGAVSLPFVALSEGRALGPVVFGTGNGGTFGGTVLWETGLRGVALMVCARALPLVGAGALAWWVHRRLGPDAPAPVPLVSLIAVCLGLRVVFEQGLFGYKLLALVVMLVVLAVVVGRITAELVAWLSLATLAYTSVPAWLTVDGTSYGADVVTVLELSSILALLSAVLWDVFRRRRVSGRAVVGFALVVVAYVHWLPTTGHLPAPLPKWLCQLALVGTGMVLAARPLAAAMREGTERRVAADAGIEVQAVSVAPAPSLVPGDLRRRAWLARQGAAAVPLVVD